MIHSRIPTIASIPTIQARGFRSPSRNPPSMKSIPQPPRSRPQPPDRPLRQSKQTGAIPHITDQSKALQSPPIAPAETAGAPAPPYFLYY